MRRAMQDTVMRLDMFVTNKFTADPHKAKAKSEHFHRLIMEEIRSHTGLEQQLRER